MRKDPTSGLTGYRHLRLTAWLVTGIVMIRFIFIGIFGPMPQDAYYFFYSQHLDLSYFDHPPVIAYILWIFTSLLGKHVFAIKLADSVITLITLFLFYRLSVLLSDKQSAMKSVLLLLSTLMITVLSLVSTPDTPLMLFWTWSLILLYQAIFSGKKVYWIWAGIAMGLAFDSKYTAVFLPAGMLLFLLISVTHRHLLLSIWPWVACMFFIATSSPVIIWNFSNNFASFRFQGAERMKEVTAFQVHPKYLLGLIGHQTALLLPVVFAGIFYGLYRLIQNYKSNREGLSPRKIFLLCFFLPLFATFFSVSLIYWVKLNWLMPAYIAGILLISDYISQKWLKVQVVLSLIIHLILAFEILYYPFPVRSDDTWMGWKELAKQVGRIERKTGADFIFSADGYKTAAELNLYMNEFVYSQNILGEHALQFDFIGTDLKRLSGKNALFIDSEPMFKNIGKKEGVPQGLKAHFNVISELEPILIMKQGITVRKFLVYLCKGYRPGYSE